MKETTVTVVGNVASDLTMRTARDGTHVLTFRVGTTPRRFDRDSGRWVDSASSFYSVTCWRTLADNVKESIRKGQPVVVTGRQRVRPWQSDGRSGITVEIEAYSVGHDLARGQAAFRKVFRQASAGDEEAAVDESLASFDAEEQAERAAQEAYDAQVRAAFGEVRPGSDGEHDHDDELDELDDELEDDGAEDGQVTAIGLAR